MAIERLNVADKKTLDNVNINIGNTDDTGATATTGTLMGKVNNIIANQQGNLYEKVVYTEDGVFKVPKGIDTIYITACGGGAGGNAGILTTYYSENFAAGGGGGGADIINRKPYSVTEEDEINITIGIGGLGGVGDTKQYSGKAGDETTFGKNGTSTIIGELVTISGGHAGTYSNDGGGFGSGNGGGGGRGQIQDSSNSESGTDSSIELAPLDIFFLNSKGGNGGSGSSSYCGGGGGGSIAKGGNGTTGNASNSTSYGAGGGGGGANSTKGYNGGKGGDGIVIIEYGDILGLVQKI